MEKADNVYVTSADFGWSDLGTWTSLYEQSIKDEHDNVLSGDDILATDTDNCFVKQLNDNKRVVIDGVKDLLVVDTDDVLLICDRRDEDHVKEVIDNANKWVKGEEWGVKGEEWRVRSEGWGVKGEEWGVKGEGWGVKGEEWRVKSVDNDFIIGLNGQMPRHCSIARWL